MSKRQILGLIGSLILFIGVFTPIISFPTVGNVNYFRNGEGLGVLILLLAIVSAFFAFTKRFQGLSVTGIVSLAVLAFTFINIRIRSLHAGCDPGEPSLEMLQVDWGWALLVLGSVLLLISAFISEELSSFSIQNWKPTAYLLLVSILVLFGYFAYGSSRDAPQTSDSPTEAYKRLYSAVKSKDTEAIKKEMSKQTIAFVQSAASMQSKPVEKVYENGLTATTFAAALPEIRDERFGGCYSSVEVYNSKETKWEDLPFALENGVWKLAIGDLFKGTFISPGKGRDQKEKEAANALSNNKIEINPNMNANTMGMTANSQPPVQKPPANAK